MKKISKIVLATLFLSFIPCISTDILGKAYTLAQSSVNEYKKAELESLLNLCREHLGNNQFEPALEYCQRALNAYHEEGDFFGIASSLNGLGITYYSMGKYQQAINYYERSLAIAREIDALPIVASSLGNLGLVYYSLKKYQQAINYYEQSLVTAREIDDLSLIGDFSNNLGSTYASLNQYQQAINYYEQSLAIAREIDAPSMIAISLTNLGMAYESLGKYQQAIEYHQQSLVINREIGSRQGEASSLNNLGNNYSYLGKYQQAIDYHQQSLVINREIGNLQGEANSLGNLGNAYYFLGKYQQAIEYHQQSLVINREIGNRQGEASSLNNLGNNYSYLGKYQQAINYNQESLAIAREIDALSIVADSLGNLGKAYDLLGQYQQAIDYHQQSLIIDREIGNRRGEANSLGNLGIAYDLLGQYQQAINYYQQSSDIYREIGNRWGEAASLSNLGHTLIKIKQFAEAESILMTGMEIFESMRIDLKNDSDRVSIIDTQLIAYRLLQQTLIVQNKVQPALEISERGRARAFIELLSARSSTNTSEFSKDELQLTTNFPTVDQIKQIAKKQNSTLVQYSEIDNEQFFVWVIKPTGEINFRQVALNSSTSAQKNKQNIDSSSSIPSTINSSQEPSVVTDTVAETRSAFGLGKERAQVEVVGSRNIDSKEHLRELHQLLIEPIADLLPTNPEERVVFIPQGGLFLVPFPALQDEEGKYLIEKHTILTAPSIQVLDLTRQQKEKLAGSRSLDSNASEMLIVGNPTMPTLPSLPDEPPRLLASLPGAEKEAIEIAQLFDTEAIIGDAATETAITQQISNAKFIHFATHGLLEYGIPEDSLVRDVPGAVAFAPSGDDDGLLTSSEILDLDLNAELVVLSACDTGRGKITGDGVIGLSRSLISAGVPSVIVSLWAVPDAPTADLMTEFYKQLEANPDKAQALRQAMLTTMKTHPNPVDWAAFTLIGEAE